MTSNIRHWYYSNAVYCSQRYHGEPLDCGDRPADTGKMLFFGSRCEKLCMMQFALISLIPGLLRRLEDCADPDLDSYERNMTMPISLKTSERNSCEISCVPRSTPKLTNIQYSAIWDCLFKFSER